MTSCRLAAALVLCLSTLALHAQSEAAKRLDSAAEMLDDVMSIKDKAIPQELLDKAQCAVLVPGLKKGAFIVGARYGRGFLSCRNRNGVGWGAPAAIRVEGGSIGFQIGGSETDVIMLIMNERGAKRLLNSRFTLGGDAAVAAGPVGRSSSAETDAYMTAEILTWSRSRGAFAGVSLSGATLRQDVDTNQEMYGKAVENKDIIFGGMQAPAVAQKLISSLNRYSSRKSG